MNKSDDEIFAEIIEKGGSVIMHSNDFDKIMSATLSTKLKNIFNSVNIIRDKHGGVKEGTMLAVKQELIP